VTRVGFTGVIWDVHECHRQVKSGVRSLRRIRGGGGKLARPKLALDASLKFRSMQGLRSLRRRSAKKTPLPGFDRGLTGRTLGKYLACAVNCGHFV
jgi:hypothetical protein